MHDSSTYIFGDNGRFAGTAILCIWTVYRRRIADSRLGHSRQATDYRAEKYWSPIIYRIDRVGPWADEPRNGRDGVVGVGKAYHPKHADGRSGLEEIISETARYYPPETEVKRRSL